MVNETNVQLTDDKSKLSAYLFAVRIQNGYLSDENRIKASTVITCRTLRLPAHPAAYHNYCSRSCGTHVWQCSSRNIDKAKDVCLVLLHHGV